MELDDTTPRMREVYRRRMDELSVSERLELGARLFRAAYAAQCAAVRQRYPEATEQEFRYHLAELRYGRELADKVFGRR